MAKIPISGSYSVVGSKATFTPTEDLPPETLVTVTLTSGIRGTENERLAESYVFEFTTEAASDFWMFMTHDSLQPVEDVDFSPDLTHVFLDPNEEEDLLNTDYRLYGTGCLKLGGGRKWEISGDSTLLANCLKNQLFNIFIPASTDTTFSIINILDGEDTSLCNIAYNASTGVLSLGSAYTAGSIIAEGQYNTFQFIESGGNYTLKINGIAVSLTGTQAIPTTGIAKLVIGASTTDSWYFDNTMFAK